MTNLTVLDNVIKAIGGHTFIDELLGRMTAQDAAVAIEDIAAAHGLDVTIKGEA